MAKITYPNKQVAVNPNAPAANEIYSAINANEVKESVNFLYDSIANVGYVDGFVSGPNLVSTSATQVAIQTTTQNKALVYNANGFQYTKAAGLADQIFTGTPDATFSKGCIVQGNGTIISLKQGVAAASVIYPTPDTGYATIYSFLLTTTGVTNISSQLAGYAKLNELNAGNMNISGQFQVNGIPLPNDNQLVHIAGTETITGAKTFISDVQIPAIPVNATSAISKSFVDNAITGITWKAAAKVATTANITLTGAQTIDATVLAVGDRVLVKNQTTAANNGIYLVSAGAWSRALDADSGTEIETATVAVTSGTVNGDTQWTCTATAIAIGTTAITFGQISGAGTYTNGSGLSLTGNVFAVTPAQPTITSLGSLTGLTISGNLTGATANFSGNVTTLGIFGGRNSNGQAFNAGNEIDSDLGIFVETNNIKFVNSFANSAFSFVTAGSTRLSLNNLAATFTVPATATSFIKTGGLSTQFLKADGSVDATVYASESRVPKQLKDFYTDAGNVGATLTDLYTFSVPANTLNADGDKLAFSFGGSYANTANSKTLSIRFGGSGFGLLATSQSGGGWSVTGHIIRTSATTYRITIVKADGSSSVTALTASTFNFTINNSFVLDATGGATSDITARNGYLEFKPAAL